MKPTDKGVLFSASDLMKFAQCEHATALDLLDLETPLKRASADPSSALLQRKGYQHESIYLERLRTAGRDVCDLSVVPYAQAADAASRAIRDGREIIFQAGLQQGRWGGIADFLRRVDSPSSLGDYRYEAADTKLARRVEPEYLFQLSLYSELLAAQQAQLPEHVHVVLGDHSEQSFRLADYIHYFRGLQARFEAFSEKIDRV